eukprot:gene2152-1321_t
MDSRREVWGNRAVSEAHTDTHTDEQLIIIHAVVSPPSSFPFHFGGQAQGERAPRVRGEAWEGATGTTQAEIKFHWVSLALQQKRKVEDGGNDVGALCASPPLFMFSYVHIFIRFIEVKVVDVWAIIDTTSSRWLVWLADVWEVHEMKRCSVEHHAEYIDIIGLLYTIYIYTLFFICIGFDGGLLFHVHYRCQTHPHIIINTSGDRKDNNRTFVSFGWAYC